MHTYENQLAQASTLGSRGGENSFKAKANRRKIIIKLAQK